MLTFFYSIGGAMPALENPLKLRWGFRSIGEFLGIDDRKAEYLVKSGRLPAAKVGKQWCASETVLTEHLEGQLRACLPYGKAK
jgi:excisionase family DNA binding protein